MPITKVATFHGRSKQRSAWLVALLAGEIDKAKPLLAHGANGDARWRCGQTPLACTIVGHHPEVLRWLLGLGQDPEQTDQSGRTPLMAAVESADLECIEILLGAGVDVARGCDSGKPLRFAHTRAIAERLLAAGADPLNLAFEGRRAILGLHPDPDLGLIRVTPTEVERAWCIGFGEANPERVSEPFWDGMIRSGISAYAAGEMFNLQARDGALWCAQRFGQSLTFLPDGRIVRIGGEHEDYYDPDFCIYNDVFEHGADGSIAVHTDPESVFPPTDFHTATLIGDFIYEAAGLAAERKDDVRGSVVAA